MDTAVANFGDLLGGAMGKEALKVLPVFFGLVSSTGILSLIFSTWCTRRRWVWVITGGACVVTSIVCAVSRIVHNEPHIVISFIFFAVGLAMVCRSLMPFHEQA